MKRVASCKAGKLYKGDFTDEALAQLCAGPAAEALLANGVPVACGGLLDEREGRAQAWTIVADDAPYSAWKPLMERMRAAIDAALAGGTFHRIYATTIYDWPEGHKLLLHLGLQYEGMARGAFGPGKHGVTYARVRADVEALPTRVRVLNDMAERMLWEDCMGQAVPWAIEQALRERRAKREAA